MPDNSPALKLVPRRWKHARPAAVIDLEKVEALAARGLNSRQLALCWAFIRNTLCRKKRAMRELDEALERGRAKGLAYVTQKLMDEITHGSIQAICFYEDAARLERAPGPLVNVNIDLDSLSDEQLQQLAEGKMPETTKTTPFPRLTESLLHSYGSGPSPMSLTGRFC